MAKVKKNSTPANLPISKNLPPQASIPTKENVIQQFVANNAMPILATLLLLTGFIIFKEYLLGKAIYLFKDIGCDGLNVTYPNLAMVSQYFQQQGQLPAWTFTQGMGQNIYPFWLDQFYWVLSLLPKGEIPPAIIWVNWFELLLSGLIFYRYLRIINVSAFASIIGGLCYAYCAYAVAASGWANRFAIELFNTALLLLALEKFIQHKSWWLIPIPIALLTIDQPFNLYPFGIFTAAYLLFRYSECYGKPSLAFIKPFLQLLMVSLLGVALASFIGFANVLQLIESPRVSGEDSYANELFAQSMSTIDAKQLMTWITRMFSNDLLGTGSEFRGWSNYFEAPMFYVGLLALLTIPQLFSYLSHRQKILYTIVLSACFLPIIFPFFRYLFWAFTGDYYRTYALFLGVIILRFGMQALSFIQERGLNHKLLLPITLVAFILLLTIPYAPEVEIDKKLRVLVMAFLVINTLLLFGLSVKSFNGVAQVLLLAVTCIELMVMSANAVNPSKRMAVMQSELSEKVGYNDYTNDALAFLNQTDKSFYRIQKTYSSSPALFSGLNDSRIQHYYGTQSYNSFNQMNYVRFMRAIDVVQKGNELTSRWISGVPGNMLLMSITNLKYLLINTPDTKPYQGIGFDSIKTVGNIKVLKNRNVLPLGITYDHFMTEEDFEKGRYSTIFKSKLLLQTCVVDKALITQLNGLQQVSKIDTTVLFASDAEFSDLLNARKADTLQISDFNENQIEGTIATKTKKILYLSIPFDSGWQATLDGEKVPLQRVQWGLTGLVVKEGKHRLTLTFSPPYKKEGTLVSLISLAVFGLMLFVTRKKSTVVA